LNKKWVPKIRAGYGYEHQNRGKKGGEFPELGRGREGGGGGGGRDCCFLKKGKWKKNSHFEKKKGGSQPRQGNADTTNLNLVGEKDALT